MLNFAQLDNRIGVVDQLDEPDTPVTLINVFTVDADSMDDLLACWTADAEFMKRQPGFISTQLHRWIGASTTFVNTAVWQDVASFRRAFDQPAFQRQLEAYPDSATARPHRVARSPFPTSASLDEEVPKCPGHCTLPQAVRPS